MNSGEVLNPPGAAWDEAGVLADNPGGKVQRDGLIVRQGHHNAEKRP